MKRLDIEFNWNGLALSLFDGEHWCGEVRFDSGGYFEMVWGADPPVRFSEERLLGQTELERKLNYLKETSSELWHNENNDRVFKGFDNRQQAEDFVKLLNDVWSGLNRALGEKYKLYCCERLGIENWFTSKS